MSKEYIIPHNYKDNGRLFNIIEKETIVKAMIWIVPSTVLIFGLLPFSLSTRFFLDVVIGFGPAYLIVMGLDIIIVDYLLFNKNRKIYYDIEKGEDYESYYEQTKKAEQKDTNTRSKKH